MRHKKNTSLIASVVIVTLAIFYFSPVHNALSGALKGALNVSGKNLAGLLDSFNDATELNAKGKRSMESVIKKISPKVKPKLKKMFSDKGIEYPPKKVTFVAIKDIEILEVWASGEDNNWTLIKEYTILGASGNTGPKLRQGDSQVPEGIYYVQWLNPNSSFHLSMRINYPNEFDKEMAKKDKRTRLGGDIFIHGHFDSIGCLAMGNAAIEELFLIANDIGAWKIKVLIMPYDFRKYDSEKELKIPKKLPEWVPILYKNIYEETKKYLKTSS